jgi:peptide subunit release factor RF-3
VGCRRRSDRVLIQVCDTGRGVLEVAAKGIEEQTRKLFEVWRLRDVPITTLLKKFERDPFAGPIAT